MTAPLATIAEALIEFILSLLRDPDAAQELNDDPEQVLARKGLTTACADDVRAVAPVVIDRPDVSPRSVSPQPRDTNPNPNPNPTSIDPRDPTPQQVAREIMSIVNNFSFDNRTTIVDQSVNQSIWAEGDVTQVFDQEAIVATGDQAIAAGDDAVSDQSDTNVAVGDVAIGNTDTTTTIDGSFNEGAPPEQGDAQEATAEATAADPTAADAVEAVQDAIDALPATIEESVEEPVEEEQGVPPEPVASDPEDSFDDTAPVELEAPPEPEFDEQ
ncbi:IniB N-terminal domain-containing protein [Microbacterium sp. BWT-B31]|uniref:IniB N-terminal domain-containing protein n=1 Tax=Microbacterium sp. BWT-B31 TaxID=3232072 RepID=UPI003526F27E